MNTYTIESLGNEPVILVTQHEDYNWERDNQQLLRNLWAALDAAGEPVSVIVDITQVRLDIARVIEHSRRITSALHPNLRETVLVAEAPIIPDAVPDVQDQGDGHPPSQTFGTLDEAMNHVSSH